MCDKRQRRIAERELLAMDRIDVGDRERTIGTLRRQHQLGVDRAHHHLGAVGLLQVQRAAGVIGLSRMTVADDDVLDLRGIEAHLLHARDNHIARFIRAVHRVEQDDAFTGRNRPDVLGRHPDPPHVVEDARRLDDDVRHRRKTRRLPRHGHSLRPRRGAEHLRLRDEVGPGDLHRRRHAPLRLGVARPLQIGRKLGCIAAAARTTAALLGRQVQLPARA